MEPIYIIIEGPDNVGKDTQIKKLTSWLIEYGQIPHILHYSNIKLKSKNCVRFKSEVIYHDMFTILESSYNGFRDRSFILNRSHIGEAVYSPLYRDYDGDYVFDIEKYFCTSNFWDRLCLVTFIDKPQNLIKRDDGKSFSINIKQKMREMSMFKRASTLSNIKHKTTINVNQLTIKEVHTEVIKFIEEAYNDYREDIFC